MLRYFFSIIILGSCSNHESTVKLLEKPATSNDSLPIKSTAARGVSKPLKLFDNKKPFQVNLTGKRIDRNTTDKDTTKCAKWTLTSKQIGAIIKNSEPINGTVWDLSFDFLSCSVFGTITQDNVEYPFTVNAGSYALIKSGDSTIIYGDYVKRDTRYFLSSPQE